MILHDVTDISQLKLPIAILPPVGVPIMPLIETNSWPRISSNCNEGPLNDSGL